MLGVNCVQRVVLGVWIVWVAFILLFPNWQEAAERETDYRKELGIHFVLTPPSPVAVPCYFVGCVTAPASYFHVLMDRSSLYPELGSVTALLVLAVWAFRNRDNGKTPSIVERGPRIIATSLIALALPVPTAPYFPLGVLAGYLPVALLHPGHDYASVLFGLPMTFALYGTTTYLCISVGLLARKRFRSER